MAAHDAEGIDVVEFKEGEGEELAEFLLSEPWPFHSGAGLTKEQVLEWVAEGYYNGIGKKTFWLVDEENERVGYMRVYDLGGTDGIGSPLFDIRVLSDFRSKGVARQGVNWLVDHVFTKYPKTLRIEATTRADNVAMRKVLRRCGFVKEAHYREAWPVDEKRRLDSIGYGILRNDWSKGTITPVRWGDEDGLWSKR